MRPLFKMVDLSAAEGIWRSFLSGIGHTVRRAAEAVQERARARGIKIRFVGSFDLCLNHDPRWTQEVFFNLLENAVKYSPEGSTVTFPARPLRLTGAVHIRDEGPGIPGEEIPRIFRKFYGERIRAAGGLGHWPVPCKADPGAGEGVCEGGFQAGRGKHIFRVPAPCA